MKALTPSFRAPTEYRFLLPAALLAELDGDGPDAGPVRRTTRDWIVDTTAFVMGFGFTLWATADLLEPTQHLLRGWAGTPHWLVWLDFAGGVVNGFALWWRRRWPVHIAVAMMPIGMFSISSAVSGLIVLFTVAVHRRFAVTAVIGALSLLFNMVFVAIRPERDSGYWNSLSWSTLAVLVLMLWGMVVRSRRQLVVSLRDRAERAESEQQLRVTQARLLERTRIAREMHDVLAHRISLLSLHAGALEFRPDAAPEEVAGAAGLIRATAHQALQDLREVIGVLREEPDSEDAPERPQPTLPALPALADEARAAGAKVQLHVRIDAAAVPDGIGRTAYRIVQEGLTNARKHAPGAAVTVDVGGEAGAGLVVAVRNPWPVGNGGTARGTTDGAPAAGGTPRGASGGKSPGMAAGADGGAGSRANGGTGAGVDGGAAGGGIAGPDGGAGGGRVASPDGASAGGVGFAGLARGGGRMTFQDIGAGSGTTIPGTGTGLIGLSERAALAGGKLAHGRTGDDEFVLTAWLPWPP